MKRRARNVLPELEPTLTSVVAPIAPRDFLTHFWKKKVFHASGSEGRVGRVLATLGSTDIEDLIDQSQQCATIEPIPSRDFNPKPTVAEALEAYVRGSTVYLRLNDDTPMTQWTYALADELGEPPIGVTSIFAVRNRNGTRLHVDWNENFTIQIYGTKRWLVAPNDFITNPVTNWEIGSPAPLYAHSSRVPTAVSPDSKAYILPPGSVLYVPRGFAHEASSVDDADSLSLNISFPASAWAVILCTLLSTKLLESPAWRESLTGAFGQRRDREAFDKQLPDMISPFCRRADALGDDVRAIVENRDKLEEYLLKRRYPIL